MFALLCGELSIVPGAESGLLLPHLKGGDKFDKRERKKKKRQRERKKTKRSL